MRRFAIGDIHGEYRKLLDVLKQVNFDYENDELISLGDVVDRGMDSYLVIEELLKIKNLICIKGNHDHEWMNYLLTNEKGFMWNQGQIETLYSYNIDKVDPRIHLNFFKKQPYYYEDQNNNLFVHAGFDRTKPMMKQEESDLIWDREFIQQAHSYQKTKSETTGEFKMVDKYNKIFIGHTPVQYLNVKKPNDKPLKLANIWCLDTGCGKYKTAPLTIMNIETEEYWQSYEEIIK